MNQYDRFSIMLSSKKLATTNHADLEAMQIDFGSFGVDQNKRIEYINGKATKNFSTDSVRFASEFARIVSYARQHPDGADLWSFFNSGIDQNLVIDKQEHVSYDRHKFIRKFKNVLIILTDGYIEAGLYGSDACNGNQCRYLSGELVKAFRAAFNSRSNKSETIEQFFHRKNYGITTASSNYLKSFEVLVLEVDDRSLTATGNATVDPPDYKIIELFWDDWMKKSGVKHFDIKPLAADTKEVQQNMLSFMGIK